MESQPQKPEFRINPENFHPCFTGLEGKAIVVAQVKRNGETILSSERFLYK